MKSMNLPNDDRVLQDLRLLVVESEPVVRDTITLVLQESGAEVVAVGSAQQGFAAVQQQQPDVVISNLDLLDSDGYSFMSRVTALVLAQRSKEIPAIAISGSAKTVNIERAITVGFKRHLSRIEPGRLVAAVANLTGRDFSLSL